MSDLTPGPTPAAAGSTGLPSRVLAHVRNWFARDVEPDLRAMQADLGRFRRLTPELKVLADAIVLVAQITIPAAAPDIAAAIAGAEEAAKVVAQIAAEMDAAKMQ